MTTIKNSVGIYVGAITRNKYGKVIPHGVGKMVFTVGGTYEGQFLDGVRNGVGKMTYREGGMYEGMFMNDKRQGEGILTYASGRVYRGCFYDDKFDGYGTMTTPETEGQKEVFYSGHWKAGKEHGKGTEKIEDDYELKGVFENGNLIKATYHDLKSESTYKGQFKDNMFHGYGELHMKGGILYSGNFHESRPKGKGSLTMKASKITFKGHFEGMNVSDIMTNWLTIHLATCTLSHGLVYKGTFHSMEHDGDTYVRFTVRDTNEKETRVIVYHDAKYERSDDGFTYTGSFLVEDEVYIKHGHGKYVCNDVVVEGDWYRDHIMIDPLAKRVLETISSYVGKPYSAF